MSEDPRGAVFAAIREARNGSIEPHEVPQIDDLLDRLQIPLARAGRTIGPRGLALIKAFEGCRLEAYRCPANVWTIGWGATGAGIGPGAVWSQEQADARLEDDLVRYAAEVGDALGPALAQTTAGEFDALVSFHYNTGAIAKATLTRLHKAGDHDGARDQFGRWINGGGRPLRGLIRRRAAEAALYSA